MKCEVLMRVAKGTRFDSENIYIDYPFEQVIFRWDHKAKSVHRKFYGEMESLAPLAPDNRLFNDTLLFGDEILQHQYLAGKARD